MTISAEYYATQLLPVNNRFISNIWKYVKLYGMIGKELNGTGRTFKECLGITSGHLTI